MADGGWGGMGWDGTGAGAGAGAGTLTGGDCDKSCEDRERGLRAVRTVRTVGAVEPTYPRSCRSHPRGADASDAQCVYLYRNHYQCASEVWPAPWLHPDSRPRLHRRTLCWPRAGQALPDLSLTPVALCTRVRWCPRARGRGGEEAGRHDQAPGRVSASLRHHAVGFAGG